MDSKCLVLIVVVSVCGLLGKPTANEMANCSCTTDSRSRLGCDCFADSPCTVTSTFDTTLLPSNLYSVNLGIVGYDWNREVVPQCQNDAAIYSYLSEYVARIPERTFVERVRFSNFAFEDDRLQVMNAWLEDVKGSLKKLEFVCGYLITLPSWALEGFRNLRLLVITATGLETIENGAFSELVPLGQPPVLSALNLEHNYLESFDFFLLHPVASVLTDLWLKNSSLTSLGLEVSTPVTFPKLETIDLSYNLFRTIPECVISTWPLSTWPLSQRLEMHLRGNPLCVDDSLCRCCSLLPLMNFFNQSDAYVLFLNCGDQDSQRYVNATHSERIGNIPLCINEFYAHTVYTGEFASPVYQSVQERCKEIKNPDAMACELRRSGPATSE